MSILSITMTQGATDRDYVVLSNESIESDEHLGVLNFFIVTYEMVFCTDIKLVMAFM